MLMNYSTFRVWITALLVALCVAVLQTENCVQNVLQATQFSVFQSTSNNHTKDITSKIPKTKPPRTSLSQCTFK